MTDFLLLLIYGCHVGAPREGLCLVLCSDWNQQVQLLVRHLNSYGESTWKYDQTRLSPCVCTGVDRAQDVISGK